MVDESEFYSAHFIQLVLGLQGSAWMLLGKVANPMTGKEEKNLDAAKATIDTIMMLREKTKGNLSKDEEEVLSNVLQQLQLNYVDEINKNREEDSKGKTIDSEEKTADTPKKKSAQKKKKTKKKKT